MRARSFGFAFVAALGLAASARAVITMDVQFASIYQADGVTGIGEGKVGLLVADEGGVPGLVNAGGTTLSVGSYLGGNSDDRIIAITTSVANVGGTGFSGFQDLFASINYDGDFGAGDKLYLLWFPTITAIDSFIDGAVSYGVYRSDAVNLASGSDIAFVAPADGSTSNLFAFDSSIVSGSGVSKGDFTAKYLTNPVPEPAVLALLGLAGFAWLFRRGRTRGMAAAGLGLIFTGSAGAQIWKNPGTASWADEASWQDGLPTSGDNTYVANGGTALVGFEETALSYGTLNVGGSSPYPSTVLVLSGGTLNAQGGDIVLGYGLNPALAEVYGPGNLSVSGEDAKLTHAGTISVGVNSSDGLQKGSGQLLISGGGRVASLAGFVGHADVGTPAGGSSVTISGEGSKWTATAVSVGPDAVLSVVDGGELAAAGGVTVAANATLQGDGKITGSLALHGTISTSLQPGTLTTGTQTWNGGGRYVWTVNDFSPALDPGEQTGWSLLSIQGALQIDSTALDPFVIDVRTLAGTSPGAAANFSPESDGVWTIASASLGVGPVSADQFLVQTDGVANAHPGRFRVGVDGNNLVLTYTAVPEISGAGAAFAALLLAAVAHRRSSRLSIPS